MIEGFEDYTGRYGFILPSKTRPDNQICDNGLLFTSEVLVLLAMLKPIDTMAKYQGYFKDLLSQVTITPGNYRRSPEHVNADDWEGPDDYIGVCVASKYLQTQHAKDVLWHGRHNDFTWKNHPDAPFTQTFLGRQIPLLGVMALCAGETPNLLERIAILVSTIITMKEDPTATSNRLLCQLIMDSLDNHTISKFTLWMWNRHMKSYGETWTAKWGLPKDITGQEAMARIYFEPGHPIVNLYKEVFEKRG